VNLRARRISIRARLALFYAAILGAALLVYGSGVYIVLQDQLERSFDAQLLANVEHAAGAFEQDVDGSGYIDPSPRLVSQLASTGGRVLVLDVDGAVIADSAPGEPDLLGISPDDLADADVDAGTVRQYAGPEDGRLTVHLVAGPDGETTGYVAWGDSTHQTQRLLAAVTTAMLAGGIAVVLIAAIIGLALARRALAPISEVTETARAITLSGDLGERVEVGQARDEVADLEVAFNEMLAALQQSHETLRQFLADVSHQLRTPLTTIRANIELAQRDDLPPADRAEVLRDAREESDRMARLVKDLLSLARAEAGVRLELEPVELDALLVDTVRIQRQSAQHVHMSVVSDEPALVEGDPDRLRELLGILLDNAARYTPDGGSVTAALRLDGHEAVVTVSDTGIGIEEEEQDRLFERLHRGSEARRLRPSGTGLGLAIARWIVDSHGGSIELHPRPGGGTTAMVKLPLR
jgi:two-component system OmpR family sensor kinase